MTRHSRLILVVTGLTLCAACESTLSPDGPAFAVEPAAVAVPITVATVVVHPSVRLVNFVGTLYGNEDVTLSSQVEGQIKSLSADLGDHIDAGQVVAQIEDDQWRARLREAEATLAKARADEARGRQLVDRKVISPQEYESMKTLVEVAQAQRDTLTVTIRHARVDAPISGAVARRFVSSGEYVHPGSQLFSLVAEDPLKLRGDVPERFAHELQVGQTVQVRVDAFPDAAFIGHLARISPASNPENRSVAVEATVDNHERTLKPGFFASAAVVTRTDDRTLLVPQEAVITFAGVTKLFVIQNGVARERRVQTGARGSGGLVEITEGLAPGELVATSGLAKLEDGVAVTVEEPAGAKHDPGFVTCAGGMIPIILAHGQWSPRAGVIPANDRATRRAMSRRTFMEVRASAVAIIGVLLLTSALAQEPPATAAAPAPRDVQLLDDVPDYATVLAHQWRDGVPQDVTTAEASTGSYGLLLRTPFQPTTLSDCIALALKNNTDLQIQRLTPVAATAGVRSALSIFDPALFADINRNRATTPSTTFLTGGSGTNTGSGAGTLFNQAFSVNAGLRKTLLTGGLLALRFNNTRYVANASIANTLVPQYTTSLGLSLNQPLLRNFGWKYSLLLVEIAQNTEQEAYHQYASAIAAIVTQVERTYWTLVLATDNVRVQEQGLELATELLRQNEGRFNVGALPHTAVLEAKVNVANRDALLIQARNSLDVARDALRAIINAPDGTGTALIMIDPQDKPTVEPYQIDLDRSLRAALEQRPELQAAKLDIHGKGLQRKVAENQLLPQANLVAGIGMNGLSGGRPVVPLQLNPNQPAVPIQAPGTLDGSYGSAVDMLADGRYYNYAVGASIDIPLDNAAAKANYSQANIALSQSKLSMQKLQEQVTLEITTAVSNLQSDLQSIEATRIARTLAEENVRDQKARYDVGLATTKDLLDYADRLTRAQFAEIEALTRYNSDLAEMRRVDGTLLSARNILLERVTPEKTPWWASF